MSVIAHNLLAMNANRQLGITNKNKGKSTEKLSSGYRINRAADDAAGLCISEEMRRQIRGLNQGAYNSEDGQSLLKVADGALGEVQEIIIRIHELSVQAANDTNTIDDRNAIQNEIDSLKTEINKISVDTEFNTKRIFNTGYIVDSDYGITGAADTSKANIDTILKSLSGSGVPQDTSETIYNISASQSGMNINGNIISWNSVSNTTSTGNLSDSVISGGTYVFNYNGSDLSFDVPNNTSLDDIANALDGIEVDVNAIYASTQLNTYSVNGTDCIGGTYSLSTKVNASGTRHTLFLKDPNGSQRSVSIEQLLQNSLSGNTLNFALGKFDFSLEFASTPTVEDVANYLNGASFQTVDNGLKYKDYYPSAAAKMISATEAVYYYHSRVTEVNDIFLAENGYQQNTDSVSLALNRIYPPSAMYEGSLKANGNIYSITSDSLDKINRITASGGIHEGDVVFIDFQSNTGGKVTVEYKSGMDFANAMDWLFVEKPMQGLSPVGAQLEREYKTDNNFSLTFQNPTYSYTMKKDGEEILRGEDADNQDKGQFWIQSGVEQGNGMFISIGDMNASLIGISDVNVTSVEGAGKSIAASSKALDIVSNQRSRIGAQQNRLEYATSVVMNTAENTQYAESRIRDLDMAKEMVEYSKQSILEQMENSILVQANQSNQSVLSLLQ